MVTDQIADDTEHVESENGSCAHYWIIDPPNGSVSCGACRICGEQREFNNHFNTTDFYTDKGRLPVLVSAAGKLRQEDPPGYF